MIRKIFETLFTSPKMSCSCGGTITYRTMWVDDYYACSKCHEEVAEEVFNSCAR
jgi:uncharacterized CHY-type Zn-finger protein